MFLLKTVKLSKKNKSFSNYGTGGREEGAWGEAWSIVAEILGFLGFLTVPQFSTKTSVFIGPYSVFVIFHKKTKRFYCFS
jgi:hypothetical protein